MFSVCANPDCRTPFDYRQGRLFRFHKHYPAGERLRNTHGVQHFWLCGVCCAAYTLEYQDGSGVLMKGQPETPDSLDTLRLVAGA